MRKAISSSQINYLHLDAKRGDIESCRRLLATGSDPNQKNATGQTPLHSAAGKGHKRICELLLEYGADINIRETGPSGQTAWQLAANNGHRELAGFLISYETQKANSKILGSTKTLRPTAARAAPRPDTSFKRNLPTSAPSTTTSKNSRPAPRLNNPQPSASIGQETELKKITARLTRLENQMADLRRLNLTESQFSKLQEISNLRPEDLRQVVSQYRRIEGKFYNAMEASSSTRKTSEERIVENDENLREFSQIIRSCFNQAFITAAALASGEIAMEKGQFSKVISAISSLSNDIPIISTALSMASRATEAADSARRERQYENLKSIIPSLDPMESAHFVRNLAIKLAIAHQDNISSVARGESADNNALLGNNIINFFTRNSELSLKAYAEKISAEALEYILSGNLRETSDQNRIIGEIVGAVSEIEEEENKLSSSGIRSTPFMASRLESRPSAQVEIKGVRNLRDGMDPRASREIDNLKREVKSLRSQVERLEKEKNKSSCCVIM